MTSSPNIPPASQPSNREHPERRVVEVEAKYSGPLPLPAHLEQYNRIVPGAGERLIKMAEEQSTHRRKLEGWAVRTNSVTAILGQLSGLYITLQAFTFAADALAKGYSGKAIAVVLVTIGTLAGIFVYGKQATAKERLVRRERERSAE